MAVTVLVPMRYDSILVDHRSSLNVEWSLPPNSSFLRLGLRSLKMAAMQSMIGGLVSFTSMTIDTACVAMNAALAVVEPGSTGLGGDCFALIYCCADREVHGLNGSGRTSSKCTLNRFKEKLVETTGSDDVSNIDPSHALNVTVPANVCGSMDILDEFGSMSRERVLSPAIDLAENGFTVGPIAAYWWNE